MERIAGVEGQRNQQMEQGQGKWMPSPHISILLAGTSTVEMTLSAPAGSYHNSVIIASGAETEL